MLSLSHISSRTQDSEMDKDLLDVSKGGIEKFLEN